MKIAESSLNGKKTLWVKEKLLVTSNFSFSHSVFKRLASNGRQKVSLCGNGFNNWNTVDTALNKHICWYQGQGHLPGSRWNLNVKFLVWLFSEKARGIAKGLTSSSCKVWTLCNISVITEDIYLKLGVSVTIQRVIHTIMGDNSKFIFSQNYAPFSTYNFILYQASNSRALAPACCALV